MEAIATPAQITAATLRPALRRRFPPKSHSLMFEVPAEPGGRSRRADAVAVGLWPSAGLHINGFELKVSREDFLREIQNPDKHIDVAKYCHYWWLVAPAGVLRKGELPSGWGLLELTNEQGNLRQVAPAPLLKPVEVDPAFLAGLLSSRSRLDDEEVEAIIKREVGTRSDALRADFKRQVDVEAGFIAKRAQQTLDRAAEIKAATGVDLMCYRPAHDTIALLKAALDGGLVDLLNRLRHMGETFGSLSETIRNTVPHLPEDAAQAAIPRLPRKKA